MNRLDMYTLGRFLSILAGSLLCIDIVFVAGDFVGSIRIWHDRSARDIRDYYVAAIPYILFLVSPIAVLLSGMFTVAGFSRRLELMAMHAAGRPLWRILLPIWVACIAYSGALVWASDTILPKANQERVRIRPPKKSMMLDEAPYRMDFAYKAGKDGILFFRDFAQPTLSGSRVVWSRSSVGKVSERIDCREARWDGKAWLLRDGYRRTFDTAQRLLTATKFDSMRLASTDAKPEDLVSKKTLPETMTRKELAARIEALRRAGEPVAAWESEAGFKVSSPWTTAIVSLLGTALAALVGRRGQAMAFGAGIFLAFCYYVAVRAGLALGHAGDLTPFQAAWSPHAFFLLLGLGFLWRASRT